jgi:hypothetical protein
MNQQPTVTRTGVWSEELERTATECATFFARRVPHWIATGNRIWGIETRGESAQSERTLQEELMYCAIVEVELRGEFTRVAFGRLAASGGSVAPSKVLVDCTKLAGELFPRICRDVDKDIQHASHFLYGVDGETVSRTVSHQLQRIADHVLDTVAARPDFSL